MTIHLPGSLLRAHTEGLWVIGDIHGALDKLRTLLRRAHLIDEEDRWTGGSSHLVFLGDYLDRGPDGAGVVRLVRLLEAAAPLAGGQVTALLGNHEVMFLAAQRFGSRDSQDRYGFREYWLGNGGQPRDAARLDSTDHAWLAARPALARAGRWLLLHADSSLYLRLGRSVEAVNAHVARLLQTETPEVWGHFANAFADRYAFIDTGGVELARQMLRTFGGERLAHGHTPVSLLLDDPGPGPTEPVLYTAHLCLALDGGLAYREDAGFIVRLNDRGVVEVVAYSETGALG